MELQVIDKRNILDHEVTTYGDLENPLFLAKDVANWIGHNQVARMIELVDEDEKLKCLLSTSGQNREMWFLTEDGLYEVLMQSRKPIAKQFKKKVKKLLKDLRLNKFNPYQNMSKELQAILLVDKRQQEIEDKVNNVQSDFKTFKDNAPLFAVECDKISHRVRKIGVRALGGKDTMAYKDLSIRGKVYSDIYHQLKREFDVSSYKAIKRCQLEKALEIIEGYTLPVHLEDKINSLNNQLSFS